MAMSENAACRVVQKSARMLDLCDELGEQMRGTSRTAEADFFARLREQIARLDGVREADQVVAKMIRA